MPSPPIRRIVIVGGGLTGWAAAAGMSNSLRGANVSIQVVVAPTERGVRLAEYTLPATLKFFEYLGMREVDVVRDTSATYRLGTEFRDWPQRHGRRMRPFGTHGGSIGFIPFHHVVTRMRQGGRSIDFNAFSLNAMAAARGRFAHPSLAHPSKQPQDLSSKLQYGLCLDTGRCARLMQRHALAGGAQELQGEVIGVYRRDSDGFIESLLLEDGNSIAGDLFIDCSGDQAWLIGETLGVEYLDWSASLPCDRMLSVETEANESLAPLLRCAAGDEGWMLRVPLQDREVTVMLFADRCLGEEEAIARLANCAGAQASVRPATSRCRNGHRARFWDRNCIALGSAAGSIEPLIFSEFHLVQNGIARLMRMFPDAACDAVLAEEYNRETQREFENARDYLLINYDARAPRDSVFWRTALTAQRSESFQRKRDVFRSSGRLVSLENETFSPAEWVAAWISADVWPEAWDPLLDRMDSAPLGKHFARMSAAIDATVTKLPEHDAYLRELLGRSIPERGPH